DLFTKRGRYVGPALKSLIVDATFATELVAPARGKGKEVAVLKHEFAEEWLHTVQPEVFVHREWPARMLSESEFNSHVRPFAHTNDVAKLLRAQFSSKADGLKYN